MKASVIIASWNRAEVLKSCLASLSRQSTLPDEVIVVWQGDDTPTRDIATAASNEFSLNMVVIHCEEPSVVEAENTGVQAAKGEVVLFIDDDGVAPPDWVAGHLDHYRVPQVGAVGGHATNFYNDGKPFAAHQRETFGKITWYGRILGNMYDIDQQVLPSKPEEVDHLVGYNMSFRRELLPPFESQLRPYWYHFEMDACLDLKSRGYKVMFDPKIPIQHYPRNTAYDGNHRKDLDIKVGNAAYNQGLILGKRSPWYLLPVRFLFLLFVGNYSLPGILLSPVVAIRENSVLIAAKMVGLSVGGLFRGYTKGMLLRLANL